MLFTDVIRTKRDGGELSKEAIQFLVDGLTDASLPAEQVSALAMAVYLNSMSFDEAAFLTSAMAKSGTVLDWSSEGLDGPVVDKHSTGGIGDKVSFMLAPIVAACGGYVPMISGRGLGHTGGTTDKAESIPGYNTAPGFDEFKQVVSDTGCAIIGQTETLAPADRRFYAIRDVTGTVESVPLITASILSKKIAAGLGSLVMDVKVGSGAFMETSAKAQEMAESIIATAHRTDLKVHALITDMNQVLGSNAGNALEIAEAIRYLRNDYRESRLDAVTLGLCAEMLLISGIETDRETALRRCDQAVTSGRAAEVFASMCAALGGPADFVERSGAYLDVAPVQRPVYAEGFLATVNTRAIGNLIIELGGGRKFLGEVLDLSVGLSEVAPIGARLDAERPLAIVHAGSEDAAARAEAMLLAACETSAEEPPEASTILEIITGNR
jgi:thymidine phosphorylase